MAYKVKGGCVPIEFLVLGMIGTTCSSSRREATMGSTRVQNRRDLKAVEIARSTPSC
ncbi:MAG: hypothetical protein ACLSVD_14505 [Eggerthellaceae bacterium]